MTDWPVKTLDALCDEGVVLLGRGNIISKKDIAANPGPYPIYSSARENEGKFGEYGAYMFNEEMITWSIDGGGRLFYRSKHKFSVTNVGGTLRVLKPDVLEIRYLHRALENLHSRKVFDWVFKAHPSVIRKVYDEIPIPPLDEQKRIVALLDAATARIGVCTEVSSTEIQLASNLYQARVEEILSADALKGVREVALGSLIELVIDHRGKTPNKLGGDFTESGVPVVSAIHIKDDSIKWSERYRYVTYEMFERWMPVRLAKGDILLTSEAPLGQVARIESDDPLVLSQRLFALRANSSLVTGDYLFEFLRSPFGQERLRARATGATAVGIRQAELMKVMVPVPRLEDQPEMIQEIQDARQTTMDFKSQIRGRVLLLKNLYQSILEAAFAGDL